MLRAQLVGQSELHLDLRRPGTLEDLLVALRGDFAEYQPFCWWDEIEDLTKGIVDLETIRLIEDFLREWAGTLIVVSHDRTFLSRTTDRLLEVRADGTVADVPGGIDAWIARSVGATPVRSARLAGSDAAATGEAPLGRQLRDAEKEMTRLERRRATLTAKIVATDDFAAQAHLGAELDQVRTDLATAEELWLTRLEASE